MLFLKLLADITISAGVGRLVKKQGFWGLTLRGSESAALGEGTKLSFIKLFDGGAPGPDLNTWPYKMSKAAEIMHFLETSPWTGLFYVLETKLLDA